MVPADHLRAVPVQPFDFFVFFRHATSHDGKDETQQPLRFAHLAKPNCIEDIPEYNVEFGFNILSLRQLSYKEKADAR
jgi:hypothetical protein